MSKNPSHLIKPQHAQTLYQDWGKDFKRKSHPRTAVEYLNKSLETNNKNTTALLARSYAKLNITDVDEALKDATIARGILHSMYNFFKTNLFLSLLF